eukprot:764141-Hanusia_phi.AAC.2
MTPGDDSELRKFLVPGHGAGSPSPSHGPHRLPHGHNSRWVFQAVTQPADRGLPLTYPNSPQHLSPCGVGWSYPVQGFGGGCDP